MLRQPTWKALDEGLNQDMGTLADYLCRWQNCSSWPSMGGGQLSPLPLAWKAQKYYCDSTQIDSSEDQSANAWLPASWKQERESTGPTRIHHYIWDLGDLIKGEDPPCRQGTLLNCPPTGVSCFKSSMKKWALADSATCKCGELSRLLTI